MFFPDASRGQSSSSRVQQHSIVNNKGDVELVVKTNSTALSSSAPPTAAADAIASDPLSETSFPENGEF